VKLHRFSTALLAAVTVAAVAACSDDDNDNPTSPGTANTTVRFVNAIGGATLDFAQNGTVGTGNGNVAYGSSSSCMRVNNANPQLAVRTAGSTTSLTGFNPTFAANGTYTVLVTGTTAAPVYTTLDDAFTTPSAGNAGRERYSAS